jgi:hypothetical protein
MRRARALLTLALLCACEPEFIVGKWLGPSQVAGAGGAAPGAGGNAGGLGGNTGGVSGSPVGGGVDSAGGAGGDSAGGAGGDRACEADFGVDALEGGAPSEAVLDPVTVPWGTGFEEEFCDYTRAQGLCYALGDASYAVVSSPARSGQSAAAFSVNASTSSAHARCVRQGAFPRDAYYGAWFYVPAPPAAGAGNWNLMYFNGSEETSLHGLWDVSVGVAASGYLTLYVFDQLRSVHRIPPDEPEIPLETWFHIEFRLLRAKDETGIVALYQDGRLIYELTGISTDDSVWGQWYVGNLADNRNPPSSTVYVDDVSIREGP